MRGKLGLFAKPQVGLLFGLVAFWKLDDLTDSTGNGYDLTSTGTHVSGKIGDAAAFDGTQLAYLDGIDLPEFGSAMTIAGWFKILGAEASYYLASAGNFEESFFVFSENGDVYASVSDGNTFASSGGSGADDGNWHFFAVARDESIKKVWLDATSGSAVDEFGPINTPSSFKIASSYAESFQLDGQLDAVGIWNRRLSDSEIDELYNAGAGLELP